MKARIESYDYLCGQSFVDNLSRIFERASYEQLAARLGVSSLHLHNLIDNNTTDFELVLNLHLSTRLPMSVLVLGVSDDAESANATPLTQIRSYRYVTGREFIVALKKHARCKNYPELSHVFNVSQKVLTDCIKRENNKLEFIVRLALSGSAKAESFCEVVMPIFIGNQPDFSEATDRWGAAIDPIMPLSKQSAIENNTDTDDLDSHLDNDMLLSIQELNMLKDMFISGDMDTARETIWRVYKMKIANNSEKFRAILSVLDN